MSIKEFSFASRTLNSIYQGCRYRHLMNVHFVEMISIEKSGVSCTRSPVRTSQTSRWSNAVWDICKQPRLEMQMPTLLLLFRMLSMTKGPRVYRVLYYLRLLDWCIWFSCGMATAIVARGKSSMKSCRQSPVDCFFLKIVLGPSLTASKMIRSLISTSNIIKLYKLRQSHQKDQTYEYLTF